MKIFEFEHTYAKEWVFAPDIEEAKEEYLSITQCGDLSDTTVKEVPKSKWAGMYIIDPDEPEPDEDIEYNEDDYSYGYKIMQSFADYADENSTTNIIATTIF